MSSLDHRSGGPSTPPLSPTAAGAVDPSAPAPTTTTAGAAAALLSEGAASEGMVEFSLSATALEMDAAMAVEAESPLPPPAGTLSRSFSRVAAAVAGSDIDGDGGIANGGSGSLPPTGSLAAMEFSVPDAVMPVVSYAAAAAAAAAPTRESEVASVGGGVSTSGLLAFEDVGGNGLGCEDQLTMEALDPMEIDALLACAGDGDDMAVNGPFATNAAVASGGGGGGASPSQLEAGNSNAFGDDNGGGFPQALVSSSPSSPHAATAAAHGDQPQGAAQPSRGPSRSRQPASGAEGAGSSASGGGGGARAAAGVRGGGGGGLPSGDGGGRRQAGGIGGGGVASTVAAGVMGALCLAGVVINSGAPVRLNYLGGGGGRGLFSFLGSLFAGMCVPCLEARGCPCEATRRSLLASLAHHMETFTVPYPPYGCLQVAVLVRDCWALICFEMVSNMGLCACVLHETVYFEDCHGNSPLRRTAHPCVRTLSKWRFLSTPLRWRQGAPMVVCATRVSVTASIWPGHFLPSPL